MEGTDTSDVQELDLLLNDKIDANDFFSKCFITNSMMHLFDMAFARFSGKSDGSGLVVLKQSMGGGKTHNMIALGLLAKYPSLRKSILGDKIRDIYKDSIPVVGFTGRDTTGLPWITIAEKLNRTNLLSQKVRDGIEAPSDKEWRTLLGGGPVLILLDEMPFYFEHAKTVPKGDSNKAVFVSAGMANLFNAINSQDLSRAMIVLSDLEAQYQEGGEFITNQIALSLKDEAERTAETIKPIDITSPEIYEILRKRLFEQYPDNPETDPDVDAVAKDYFKFVHDLEKAGLATPDAINKITLRFKECYPFHPIIVDLIANFKNNLKFQQTRGLLRLFRRYVRYLYTNQDKFPDKRFISVSDYDLSHDNGNDMSTIIMSINQSLENAIRSDVYSSDGASAAQMIDKQYKTGLASKFARAILFASLSATDPELAGLSEEEIYLAALEPTDDTTKAVTVLEEYWRKTSYSKENRRGKRYFGYNENVVSQKNNQLQLISSEYAETILINALKEYFYPRQRDCYQAVYQKIVALITDIRELQLKRNEITLVITKPIAQMPQLNDVFIQWWERQESNKNRVMFLTGQERNYAELLSSLKEYIAWNAVFDSLKNQVNSSDPEYRRADTETSSAATRVLEKIKSTFNRLYYPYYDMVEQKDCLLGIGLDYDNANKQPARAGQIQHPAANAIVERLLGNNRDGEVVIKAALTGENKYIELDFDNKPVVNSFSEQFNIILIGGPNRKRIKLDEILQRAADKPAWYWHRFGLIEEYVDRKIAKGDWVRDGDNIIIKPELKASVEVTDAEPNFETDEIVLKLKTNNYTSAVYYSAGDTFDESNKTEVDLGSLLRIKPGTTAKYTFVAMAADDEVSDSDLYVYTCPIAIKKTDEYTDSNGLKHITIKSLPKANIYYTTDGSSPVNSNTKKLAPDNEIIVDPAQVKKVIVVAQLEDAYSKTMDIEISDSVVVLDKGVIYNPKSSNQINCSNKESLYAKLNEIKEHNAKIANIAVNLENSSGRDITVEINEKNGLEPDRLLSMIETVINQLAQDDKAEVRAAVRKLYFETGRDFIKWLGLYNRKPEECIDEYEQI